MWALQRDAPGQTAGEVDPRRIAAGQDAALRGEEEVVEGATAHQLEHSAGSSGVQRGELGHVREL